MSDSKKTTQSKGADDLPAIDFSTFVLSLSHSALVHLGDAPPPDGHGPERDLLLAKQTIDLLGILQEKTRNNLSGEEERLLDQALYDLRLRFVEIFQELVSRLAFVALGVLLVVGGCKKQSSDPSGAEGTGLPKGAVLVPPTGSASTGIATPPSEPVIPHIGAQATAVSPPLVPLSFAGLARAADPGVVTIISLTEEVRPTGRRRVISEGLGTGFVYDKTGLVLTNNHVVEDATQIKVKFTDGRDIAANIVGRDKLADVAVIRVEDKNIAPLALGDSDALDVGDWVVAIGNPFGLSHTVSAGILSARGRTREDVKGLDENGYFNFLQTDAAINQGNSGGPLLNLKGEVVGINAAIRANANGIGFAIPINMVKELLPILLREGKVVRSALGVVVDPVNEAEATRLKRSDRKGAWIKMVQPGGGADRAGLQAEDVILSFDGKPVPDPNQLRWLASLAGVGRTVTVRVQRLDKVFDVRVTLGPLPPTPDE